MTDAVIIGRARIAYELGLAERTVSRWIKRGLLPATYTGPSQTTLLQARRSDLERIKATFDIRGEAA